MFKRVVLTAVAVAGMSVAAIAADMPVKGPVYKAAPAVFNWTGLYAGVQAGYGWGDLSWDETIAGLTAPFSADGAIGGITVGYNWQARGSRWVYGIEADISTADIGGTGFLPCSALGCSTTLEWLGTVRGRVGYAQNNWLFYATGGVAFGGLHFVAPAVAINTTNTQVGWTIGTGIEMALARRGWSVKGEYLYVDLGSSDTLFAANGAFADNNQFHIARLGVNYRW